MAGQNPFAPGMTSDVFIPDQLVSGPLQVVTENGTIGQAGLLKRGTILGKITASKIYVACVKTASDGSQSPVAILVDDIDTTAGAKNGGVYLMGEFNAARVIYDPSWASVDDLRIAMRPLAIFLRNATPAA
ncbi:head decoration protein [Serratia fonticola]|uniref:head decoration protein n=1 Tax=Serratia fonticola TaxID=47917 RepID=UPI00093BBE35|nr:head decoration protein [Serratia fonticola]OKP27605.1 head decoration protein [Serratia fonticola]